MKPTRTAVFTASLAVLAAGAGIARPVQAQESPWSLRVGPAQVAFSASSHVDINGAPMPGARVGVSDNTIAAFEVAYRLSERWTTRLALGIPPTTTLSDEGSLKAYVPPLTGTAGRATYGPAVWSLTWRPFDFERVRPYIGAGVNYTLVSKSEDGDVQGLKVKSAWGSALEAGLDVPLDAHWSLFVDVRKVFVKTTATGTVPALGGPSAKAYVTLNPTITHVGLGYRF